MKLIENVLIATGISLVSPIALAHDQLLTTGFTAGLLHPLTGIDHLLALMLVGFFIGRHVPARWGAVIALQLAVGAGAAAGLLLGAQAWIEAAFLLSFPFLFAAQWIRQRRTVKFAIIAMGLFLIAHGWAHGVALADMNQAFFLGLLIMSTAIMFLFSVIGGVFKLGSVVISHGRH